MEFRSVAIIGAGAVGSYFIYGFSGLGDVSLCLVAEGERAARLKENGVIINEKVYRPEVKTPDEAHGVDLLLVCTKYHGLSGALDSIERVCDEHTTVMSLLNGIDSEDIIGDRIGHDHMLYSVTRISSERRNGKIRFVPETTIGISFGEKDTKDVTPRMKAFEALMKKAGLHYFVKDDIIFDQWSKYSMNIIYNLPQAVLNVPFGAYYDSQYVGAIRDRMYEEVQKVAAAEGVTLKEQGDWRSACVKSARFSTLQDIDAGRHTEVDMFAGVLIKLAKKHGIEVPFCEFCYIALKALEEKGDGKFEY